MNIFDLLYGRFPMVMAPDEGGDGGGAGDSGDGGNQGGDGADTGADEGAGDAGQDDKGGEQGAADDKGAAADAGQGGDVKKVDDKSKADDKAVAPVFAESWREELAKDKDGKIDEKELARLKRFNSPKDMYASYAELTKKITAGEFKKPLSKDAKPEEIAAYRKENGIPEKPEEYLKGLPEGLVLGDKDMAVVTPFLEDMHKQNVPPAAVHSALDSYQKAQALQVQMTQERDLDIANECEDKLRADWGADYRANMLAATAFVNTQFPSELQDALMNARLGDDVGTPIMNSPSVLEAFAKMGRILNPSSTLTHNAGSDTLETINSQIATYEARMGTKEWFKDDKANAHYRELVTARDRMQSKG